jgi:hypothetical protein
VGEVATAIAREANVPVHHVGRSALIARDDAEAFLRACAEARGVVLGIEGFHVVGERLEPDMGWIADFSDLDDVDESLTESRSFLAGAPSDLFFDFFVVGRDR